MEAHSWRRVEVKVLDTQVRHLLRPRPGVVEQEQQRSVSQGMTTTGRQAGKECRNLVALQKAHLG
jgi:hypothetical protein